MRSRFTAVLCSLVLLSVVGVIQAQEALIVGEHFKISIDSGGISDVPATVTSTGYRYTVKHPGATYIALHFAAFDLTPGEAVVISDGNGKQSYRMTGRGKMDAGTFWSQHVKGDKAVIEWITRAATPGIGKGFIINEYVAGFVDLGGAGADAICGSNDQLNAVCYESTHATEYDRSRAVARLLIQGSSLCTGWLVSATDHLLTNEHCISSSTAALNTDYEFMAEAANCGDSNCQLCHPGVIFSGASFVQDNPGLDYALVTLNGNPSATYGFLSIDNRSAVVGEEIYIPQYPAGRAKELGIESSDASDPNGLCTVTGFSPGCSSSAYNDVGYQCDTEGGSSGSPVLARSSHKVIALHHCANCPNRGVPIDLICDEVCSFFGPECTVNGDCDDSNSCTSDTCVSQSCVHDPIADCCGNSTCETGEDCMTCSSDCDSGASFSCGNGICETIDGEDCLSCPSDCNGVTSGRPSNRYCCGSDICEDARCMGNGNTCTVLPGAISSCCGDTICEGNEDGTNCAVDCAACSVNADCDDGSDCTSDTCNAGACSNTPIDCSDGNACTVDTCSGGVCFSDTTISCGDGDACTIDSCDSGSGCVYVDRSCQDGDGCCPSGCDSSNDNDCSSVCQPLAASCTLDEDCCSNKCRGRQGGKVCK